MPILPLSYRFIDNGRTRSCGFNDATGVISGVSQGLDVDFSDPNLRDVGYIVTTSGGYEVKVIEAYPYFFVEPEEGGGGPACVLSIDTVIATNNSAGAGNPPNGKLQVFADGVGSFRFRITKSGYDSGWTATGLFDYEFTVLEAGDYTVYVEDTESVGCQRAALASVVDEGGVVYDDLVASATSTNETAAANNDGKIDVVITEGSGEYEITWDDLSTTGLSGNPSLATKSPLAAGSYDIVVKDLITLQELPFTLVITEPALQPEILDGTYLFFPPLNSLTFLVDPIVNPDNDSTFQKLDNMFFRDQLRHPGDACENYFQKVNKADRPKVQFYSDFGSHDIEVRNYFTDEVLASYPIQLKETNIGATVSYPIRIEGHDEPNKSRVYFQAGALQTPITIGQTFQVTNNADGFNGNYIVSGIQFDSALGYQYLIINLTYSAPGSTSNASGVFIKNVANFNVFESQPWFTMLEDGKYYLKVRAYNSGSVVVMYGYSEPFEVKVNHVNTLLIEYRNIDNAFDTTWTTGYQGYVRVPGILNKRLPGGEKAVSRNADFTITKTNAKKIRALLLEVVKLTPYLHEKLDCVVDCDIWTINKMPMQTGEAWSDPVYIDHSKLSNRSIKVETPWFAKYNSNDLGTVSDGGFLALESGLLKL